MLKYLTARWTLFALAFITLTIQAYLEVWWPLPIAIGFGVASAALFIQRNELS